MSHNSEKLELGTRHWVHTAFPALCTQPSPHCAQHLQSPTQGPSQGGISALDEHSVIDWELEWDSKDHAGSEVVGLEMWWWPGRLFFFFFPLSRVSFYAAVYVSPGVQSQQLLKHYEECWRDPPKNACNANVATFLNLSSFCQSSGSHWEQTQGSFPKHILSDHFFLV